MLPHRRAPAIDSTVPWPYGWRSAGVRHGDRRARGSDDSALQEVPRNDGQDPAPSGLGAVLQGRDRGRGGDWRGDGERSISVAVYEEFPCETRNRRVALQGAGQVARVHRLRRSAFADLVDTDVGSDGGPISTALRSRHKEDDMWFLVARQPYPDAEVWPGRRSLSVVDALAWPVAWVLFMQQAPEPVGLIGPFVTAVAVLSALSRLHRAVWVNHRYRFTTWRWGRIVAAMLLMGFVMKLALGV